MRIRIQLLTLKLIRLPKNDADPDGLNNVPEIKLSANPGWIHDILKLKNQDNNIFFQENLIGQRPCYGPTPYRP